MYQFDVSNVALLERIRTKLEEAHVAGTIVGLQALGGELGAENPTDEDDALNMYLDTILERLVEEMDLDEDEAMEMIFAMADILAEEGELPEFPSDDSSSEDVSMWLGQAKTIGFERVVLDAAYETE